MPLKIERQLAVIKDECVPREPVLQELASGHRAGESDCDHGSRGLAMAQSAHHENEDDRDDESSDTHCIQQHMVIFDESRPNDVPSGIGRIVDHLAPPQSAQEHTSYQGPIGDALVLVNLIAGAIGWSKHELRCLTVKLVVSPACVSTIRSAVETLEGAAQRRCDPTS